MLEVGLKREASIYFIAKTIDRLLDKLTFLLRSVSIFLSHFIIFLKRCTVDTFYFIFAARGRFTRSFFCTVSHRRKIAVIRAYLKRLSRKNWISDVCRRTCLVNRSKIKWRFQNIHCGDNTNEILSLTVRSINSFDTNASQGNQITAKGLIF